ncbi:MAG: phosphatase PAP2 family protein, partial [Bacteroidales bacterium]|nr:phosphatase PAP2 family protein [Bacteroidales bacterium]
AANAFGFAYCSFLALRTDRRLRYRGYAAGIFTWAALVSVSRVFVSMHFFGDILVGTAAGCLIGAIWGCIGRWCIGRWLKPDSQKRK